MDAGVYYHLAKRFAGIRYIFLGKPAQQRPRLVSDSLLIFEQMIHGCTCRRPRKFDSTHIQNVKLSRNLRVLYPVGDAAGKHLNNDELGIPL